MSAVSSSAGATQQRFTVFTGGPVLTMTARHEPVSVVVVAGGRIHAVGDTGLLATYPGALVVDLAGRTLVPGFIDAHCHLSIAALQPLWADCSAAATGDELGGILRRHRRDHPGAGWVRADRWDESTTGLRFDRRDLDAATGDTPTIVVHHTYHQCVVSSAGLDRLGIGRGPDRDDDCIDRDRTGEPTGLLIERAFGRAHSESMAAYQEPDRWAEHVEHRASELLRHGITAVHDAACGPAAEQLYRTMAADRRLPVSVLVMPHPDPFLSHDLGARLDGPPTGEGDEQVRVGPVKLFADGGVAPAIDVHHHGNHIAFGYRHVDLTERLVAAVERGFRVAVHAMGNRGIADALDAFEAARRRCGDGDHRFRIEHAGLASPPLARRAAALGAVAVVQPGFVEHVGRSTHGFTPDDAAWLPFATLTEAGVDIAGSSDDPCGPVAPMGCAALGRSRTTSAGITLAPEEALPIEDWLRAYTAGAAHAGGQEDERGAIAPGMRADLVILSDIHGSDLTDAVEQTWVDGRCVYPGVGGGRALDRDGRSDGSVPI